MGEARNRKTANKVIRDNIRAIEELKANQNNKKTPPTISIPSGGTSPSTIITNNALKRSGDTMTGAIAFSPIAQFIGTNLGIPESIDISPAITSAPSTQTSYILVSGTNPDDLKWILGAAYNGQFLILQGTNQIVINIKSATTPGTDGNIITPDGADVVLDGTTSTENAPAIILVFDPTVTGGGSWRVVSGAGGGGGASGYNLVEDDGTPLAQRTTLDFRGDTVTALDDGAETELRIFSPSWKKPARVLLTGFNFFFPNIQETEDGVTLVPGDRVLLTAELNPVNNGIWEVQAPLIPGTPNQYLLARPLDFLFNDPAYSETFIAIEEGTAGKEKLYRLTSFNPMVIDTDPQTWAEFTSGGGGGILDPILLNEQNLGTIGPTSVNIDWSLSNYTRVVLTGGLNMTHINLPNASTKVWQEMVVEFTQDGIGGHTVSWTQGFANGVVPTLNPTPGSKTVVTFYAYWDGGASVILAFETNVGTSGLALTDLSNLVPTAINQDLNFPNTSGFTIDYDGNNIALGATAGFDVLPANPVGFINIKIGGAPYKIPYYSP